jgi:hypothetical protein
MRLFQKAIARSSGLKMRLNALGVLVGVILFALGSHARVLRVGDSIGAVVRADNDGANLDEFPGITLCIDGTITVMSPIKLTLSDGFETDWLKTDTTLRLEAHEGKVLKMTVDSRSPGVSDSSQFSLSFKWTKCTMENDEVLPMQVLFALGSIASVAIFIAILFDSRLKRSDKYF